MVEKTSTTSENQTENLQGQERVAIGDVRSATEVVFAKKLNVQASYDELESVIPELRAMKGVDQKSDFHALTLDEHTRQMGKGLESNPFVQSHPKRDLIVLAGKLHDIGKMSPEGQQIHPKDPNKRQYVNHEKESEKIVRELLPLHFELSSEDQEIVARLAGLHASALNLLGNFEKNNQPKGKELKSYDEFMAKMEELPLGGSLEDKMRIIFAINRADKMAGVNGQSDRNDPKVQAIIEKSDKQIKVLDELEKALPAMVRAVLAKRAGDQLAGVVLVGTDYRYSGDAPDAGGKTAKKAEINPKLKPLGGVLRDKMKTVAEAYGELEKAMGNPERLNGLIEKLGLSEDQTKAVIATLKN